MIPLNGPVNRRRTMAFRGVQRGRRRRPGDASHQILIGNSETAIGVCSRSADRGGRVARPAPDPSQVTGRYKGRDNQLHRARTRSSNPVPSSGESTNFRFLLMRACSPRQMVGVTPNWSPSSNFGGALLSLSLVHQLRKFSRYPSSSPAAGDPFPRRTIR